MHRLMKFGLISLTSVNSSLACQGYVDSTKQMIYSIKAVECSFCYLEDYNLVSMCSSMIWCSSIHSQKMSPQFYNVA